jgi:hypothetical protein
MSGIVARLATRRLVGWRWDVTSARRDHLRTGRTAVAGLIVHTDEINRLNVFPVADADTGTNMLFTMRAACARADRAATTTWWRWRPRWPRARCRAAATRGHPVADPAGLADVTAEAADERDGDFTDVGATVFGAACDRGRLAVASVGETVPGTIVSVLQAAAGAAEDAADDGADLVSVVGSAAERRRSPWRRPNNNSTCSPGRAWSMREGGAAGPARRDEHRAGRAPAAAGRVPAGQGGG